MSVWSWVWSRGSHSSVGLACQGLNIYPDWKWPTVPEMKPLQDKMTISALVCARERNPVYPSPFLLLYLLLKTFLIFEAIYIEENTPVPPFLLTQNLSSSCSVECWCKQKHNDVTHLQCRIVKGWQKFLTPKVSHNVNILTLYCDPQVHFYLHNYRKATIVCTRF